MIGILTFRFVFFNSCINFFKFFFIWSGKLRFVFSFKYLIKKHCLIGTIQWNFRSLEYVRLLYWNSYSRGNFVRGIDCAYRFRHRIPWTFEKNNKKVKFRLLQWSTSRLFNLKVPKSSFMSPAGQNYSNWFIIFDQMKVEVSRFNLIPINIFKGFR